MAGRWMMASIQTSFAIMPAAVVLVRRDPARARLARDHGADAGLVHDAADAALLPGRLAARRRLDVQTSLALFDRIFEYLDEPIDIVERPSRPLEAAGDVSFEDVWFRYDAEAPWTLSDVSFTVPAGTKTALVGETGAGRRRSPT